MPATIATGTARIRGHGVATTRTANARTGFAVAIHAATQDRVTVRRIPGGGVQPQAAVDAKGVVHLIYLKGDPTHCDVDYIRSADGGDT